jgi:hypothetical protein
VRRLADSGETAGATAGRSIAGPPRHTSASALSPARLQNGAIMLGDVIGRITMREMTRSPYERRRWLHMVLLVMIAAADPATAATRVPVDPNTPPWNAVTKVQTNIGTPCTGVLIASSVVLTAAYCLYNPRTRALLQPVSLHVLFGFERGNYHRHLLVARYRLGPEYMPGLRQPQPAESECTSAGRWRCRRYHPCHRGQRVGRKLKEQAVSLERFPIR